MFQTLHRCVRSGSSSRSPDQSVSLSSLDLRSAGWSSDPLTHCMIPCLCLFLSSEEDFEKLPSSTVPEMQRSNLAPVILQLKALGIDNVLRFSFLSVSRSTPPTGSGWRGRGPGGGAHDDITCCSLTVFCSVLLLHSPPQLRPWSRLLSCSMLLEVRTLLLRYSHPLEQRFPTTGAWSSTGPQVVNVPDLQNRGIHGLFTYISMCMRGS